MLLSNTALEIEFKRPTMGVEILYRDKNGEMAPYFKRDFTQPVKKTIVSFPFKCIDAFIADYDNVKSFKTIPLKRDRFRFNGKRVRNKKLKHRIIPVHENIVAYCDIYTGDIFTGKIFEDMTLCEKIFAIEHEKAHDFYDEEKDADAHAMLEMVKKGFPVIHAYVCLERYLTPSLDKEERIESILKHIENV